MGITADKRNKQNFGGKMEKIINKILNEYITAKQEPFAMHPIGSFFRNDIPREIYNTGIVNSREYLVTGADVHNGFN